MRRYFPLFIILLVLSTSPYAQLAAQTTEYRLMHEGNRQFRAGRYDQAATYYLKALKRNPHNTRALFNMADTYLAKGNAQAADSLYQQVTQQEKNKQIRSMAWHNRGYISQTKALHDQQNQQQLLREAITHYKQALRLNPRDNDTRYNLALCQRQLKEGGGKNNQQKQKQPQQQKKEQQQNQQKQPQQQKEQQKSNNQSQDEVRQTEQYLNLARQAERRALEKIKNQQPRQKSLDKNW